MPVKSVPTLGLSRKSAAVSVLLAMDAHRAQAGQRLRLLRERAGLSQEDLARKAQLSYKTVNRFENGKHEGRRATVRQLSEALGVDEFAILGEPPNPLGVSISDQVGDVRDEFRGDVDELRADIAEISRKLDRVLAYLGANGEREDASWVGDLSALLGERPAREDEDEQQAG